MNFNPAKAEASGKAAAKARKILRLERRLAAPVLSLRRDSMTCVAGTLLTLGIFLPSTWFTSRHGWRKRSRSSW